MACTHLVGSKSCERETAGSICACCIVLPVQPRFIFFPPFLPRCGVGALPRSAMQPFHAGSLWDDVCDSDGPELSSAHADGPFTFSFTPHDSQDQGRGLSWGRYPSGFPDRSWGVSGDCKGRFWGIWRFSRGVSNGPPADTTGPDLVSLLSEHLSLTPFHPTFLSSRFSFFLLFNIMG
jgi:hypothetical protein